MPGPAACIPVATTLYIIIMTKPILHVALALLAIFALGCGGASEPEAVEETESASGQQYLAYFGTYTKGDDAGKGIYAYRFDTGSGKMTEIGLAAEITNPSFIAIHPNNKYLYAVTEAGGVSDEENLLRLDLLDTDVLEGDLHTRASVQLQGDNP